MKKNSIIIFVSIAIAWLLFAKYWVGSKDQDFDFSNREKEMVFPTPLTVPIDQVIAPSPTPTPTIQVTLTNDQSIFATDSSVIKY